jgi:hypothetical protein
LTSSNYFQTAKFTPANNDSILVAFLVVKSEVSASEIKEYLKDFLPEYMLLVKVIFLEAIPLTHKGKVDKKRLSHFVEPLNKANSFIKEEEKNRPNLDYLIQVNNENESISQPLVENQNWKNTGLLLLK